MTNKKTTEEKVPTNLYISKPSYDWINEQVLKEKSSGNRGASMSKFVDDLILKEKARQEKKRK